MSETATEPTARLAGGFTAYGLTVYAMGYEGEWIVAFGHHDERRFLAACNRYARVEEGLAGPWDSDEVSYESALASTERKYARFEPKPHDAEFEWALSWQGDNLTTAVTVLERC